MPCRNLLCGAPLDVLFVRNHYGENRSVLYVAALSFDHTVNAFFVWKLVQDQALDARCLVIGRHWVVRAMCLKINGDCSERWHQ